MAGPGSVDPGARSAQTLAIVALVLSFVCGIGLLIAPVSLVMAMRAERRIRASGGWLDGAAQARTARIMSWVAIGIGVRVLGGRRHQRTRSVA